MMSEKLDIITIGESLIELSSDKSLGQSENLTKYYGGDTLTSAIAALRLGSKVGYITKVGNDHFKDFLLDSWKCEGLDISQVKTSNDYNGIYMIARVPDGKKEFAYYRKKTAATKLSIEDISADYIKNSKIFYTSGVAQSLSLSAKEAVKKAYVIAKENGVTTAYDPNFSPLLATIEDAKEYFEEVIENIDVLFLSARNDVKHLFDLESAEKTIKHFWDIGVQTVVIKGTNHMGYYTGYNGDIVFCKYFTTDIVDTTSASSAFNGGFLHSINSGYSPFEATRIASIVAGLQAQGIGAIKSIPTKAQVYEHFKKGE